MDINTFTKIFRDKHFVDYQKLKYKYDKDFDMFLQTLKNLFYKNIPLNDFDGNNMVYIQNYNQVNQNVIKFLLHPQNVNYGFKAAENEIVATSAIESIDFARESVRKVLKGMAPENEQENRILGIKKGLSFIADVSNKITEENLYKLYMMTVGDFLSYNEKLMDNHFYRHDAVFVVSNRVEHSGLSFKKLPRYMKALIEFANSDDDTDDLVKACIIHFYIAFIHPYFDGNGRIARLVHLWFLIQKGYKSALFVPFSSNIEKSRKEYYDAFTTIENNRKYCGKIDVTPFLFYFSKYVYSKINEAPVNIDVFSVYDDALCSGKITEKEAKLWQFVVSYYGAEEFSTKQLEKDFGNAAYATIRAFVLKFEKLELLSHVKYGVRIKYKINS